MNRREFVKTPAAIPLLGLLVKVPETEEEFKLIMPGDPGYIDLTVGDKGKLNLIMPRDPDYIDVSVTSQWHTMTYEGDRLIHDDGESDYWYIGDKEPYLPSDHVGVREGDWMLTEGQRFVWNGEKWIQA